MADDGGDPVYYVISDLHIGGDEQLEEVDFLDELLQAPRVVVAGDRVVDGAPLAARAAAPWRMRAASPAELYAAQAFRRTPVAPRPEAVTVER